MGRLDDPELKRRIFERDGRRCRWCGQTNAYIYDIHHIRYRRSEQDDVPENLITLCRKHHDFVHQRIPKEEAQRILFMLVDSPGLLGMTIMRREMGKRKRACEECGEEWAFGSGGCRNCGNRTWGFSHE